MFASPLALILDGGAWGRVDNGGGGGGSKPGDLGADFDDENWLASGIGGAGAIGNIVGLSGGEFGGGIEGTGGGQLRESARTDGESGGGGGGGVGEAGTAPIDVDPSIGGGGTWEKGDEGEGVVFFPWTPPSIGSGGGGGGCGGGGGGGGMFIIY